MCVSFLPSKYLKVELLGLRVYVCLLVYEAVKQFSKRANHFTYPVTMYMSSSSFLTSIQPFHLQPYNRLQMVLFCSSLISHSYIVFVKSLGRGLHFLIGFSSSCHCKIFLCILDTVSLSEICKYFLPIGGLPFYLLNEIFQKAVVSFNKEQFINFLFYGQFFLCPL